jgi:hypothetical protein
MILPRDEESFRDSFQEKEVFIIYKTKYKSSQIKKEETMRVRKKGSRRLTRDDIVSAYSISALHERFNERQDFLYEYLSLTKTQGLLKNKVRNPEKTSREFWEANQELEAKILDSKKYKKFNKFSYLFLEDIKKRMLVFLRKKNSFKAEMSNLQFNFKPNLEGYSTFPTERCLSKEYNKISFSFTPMDYQLIEEISRELKYFTPTLNHETAGMFLLRKAMRQANNGSFS